MTQPAKPKPDPRDKQIADLQALTAEQADRLDRLDADREIPVSEFTYVETPAVWPQACVLCKSAKGPLVDTMQEGPLATPTRPDRIYVCAMCVKLAARTLGLTKGDRNDKLLAAGAQLDDAEQRVRDRDQQIQQQIGELAARQRKIEALDELLQQERDNQRTRQHLVETISESSRALLEVAR